MQISMQGNWTVRVKSKNASFPQRFIITGATSGNGVYAGAVATPAVAVTGNHWSIFIQHDAGAGFQVSATQLKFPQKIGSNYVFEIHSNDSGGDTDFDDLILSCSTPASTSEHLVYGNVSLYSGICFRNPCFPKVLVIDRYEALVEALKIPRLKEAIEKLYPERIPVLRPPFPPDPDPEPDFKPMVINLLSEIQIPPKQAVLYKQLETADLAAGKKAALAADAENLVFDQVLTATGPASLQLDFNRLELAKSVSALPLRCRTEAAPNITLHFEEYDRTAAELAGNPYTGTGTHEPLGSAVTDMFGNYIFRYHRGLADVLDEAFSDKAVGENVLVQIRPDLIAKVVELVPSFKVVYESAPYFNVPQLKRIDICLPKSKVRPASYCFNGNLIGSLGNVFVDGAQNTAATIPPPARSGPNSTLSADGVVTVTNLANLAGFKVDCACWAGTIDLRGCLFNTARKAGDPVIRHYTIRYKKPADADWSYVTESYHHPKFPGNVPQLVGPFSVPLQVDGNPAAPTLAYTNIQAEAYLDNIPWQFANLDRYMRLNTAIYQDRAPGTVYFRVDGYDAAGQPVPNATDLIALYIDNTPLNFGLGNVSFFSPIEYVGCGLYKMAAGEMRTPLRIQFKANDVDGFVNDYKLRLDRCPTPILLHIDAPPPLTGTLPTGVLLDKNKPTNTLADNCPGYKGTLEDFGTNGFVDLDLQPDATEDGWLKNTEEYAAFSIALTANRRATNGYNDATDGLYQAYHSFGILRK